MAADVSIASGSSGSCCAELKEKYHKMEKKRNALKEAVNLLELQINKIVNEKVNLKKAFKEEKRRGDLEREAKDKEITLRKTLENELRELKAQLSSLSEETKTLNPCEKTGEEIERLERLLEDEKRTSLSEKKKAMEVWNLLELEKIKVEEERRLLGVERGRSDEFRDAFEGLKGDFEGVKDQFEKALEEEKQKMSREKRRADTEKVKFEEQKKVLEREKKSAMEEKKRADILLKQLQEERERNKGLQVQLSSQNTQKEKIQIDNLLKQLQEERERNKGLQAKLSSQNTQKEKIQIDNLSKQLKEERERNKGLQAKLSSQNTLNPKTQIDNLSKKLEEERGRNKSLQTKIASFTSQNDTKKKLDNEREKNKKLKSKIEALTSIQTGASGISVNNGNLEVKILKEKLKFRKEQLKHVKSINKLEKAKNNLIKQHFDLLKQDFVQLINRFKLIDIHLGIEDTNHSTKARPVIGLVTPVEGERRKSQSIPASGTSSESIRTKGQKTKKYFTDKKLLLGPQERERDSSVSSPVLQIHKISGTSLHNSIDPLKTSRKRKRKETKLDPPIKEKIQNSEFVEFEKRVRNGGVLKLLEFENEELERRFRDAMERPLSPNIPQIVPGKIVKEPIKENWDCILVRDLVENEKYLFPNLDTFELEIGSNLTKCVPPPEDKGNCENVEGINEKEDISEGHAEKFPILDYLVVFSTLKADSLERVKNLWKNMNFYHTNHSRVLEVASKSELIPEERACIVYSLLACNISQKILQNSNLDFASNIGSFRDEIFAVISEGLLKLLAESKTLEKIILLMEEFMIHKQVLVYKNGDFCTGAPTKDQIISNCILLASICVKINRFDIILAAAYKILLEGKNDISQSLLSVHVFTYICGERLFSTDQKRFLSRAVRWVVLRLEKSGTDKKLWFLPCEKCPFEIEESSLEGFVDSLLDEVKMCCSTINPNPNPNPNFTCGEECNVYKAERNGLCCFVEIISLIELVAKYMDWKDVYEKVLVPLLKISESPMNEEFSASVLVLIGQLARFGVGNGGCEQLQVSELRKELSKFIKMETKNGGLPLQFASVSVLLTLIPFEFTEVVTGEDRSLSNPGEFDCVIGQIKRWFSQLNEEQRAASQSLFMKF